MILNENKFFHLNFYSSWCSFFSLSFRTNIAFNELFKRTKILIWKELFCPVVTYYICRPIRRFFYYRNLPAQSKLSRNLINNFFNYLRFFIWTGNFNRHYTSTLMARACESNDNKTKGFFFFFLSCTCSWVLSASWMESQVTLPLEVLWCHMRRTARLNRQQLRKV